MSTIPASLRIATVAAVLLAGLAAADARADYQLTIMHTTDILSRLDPVAEDGSPCDPAKAAACYGGVARLAHEIALERARSPNVLVIDAGGSFTGAPVWEKQKQHCIADVMNKMKFDAVGLGYTEFQEGSPVLAQFIKEARFPVVAANLDVEFDPLLKDQVFPIDVIEKGGERIGLIGYVPEDMAQVSHPSKAIQFSGIETAIRPWVKRMREAMGVNKVVAISYAGLDRDKRVAATVDGINVIISGNPKETLSAQIKQAKAYPMVVKGPKGKPVLVVQAARFGQSIGKIDIIFDKKGGLKKWTGGPVMLDQTIADDAAMKQEVQLLEGTSVAVADQPVKTAARQ